MAWSPITDELVKQAYHLATMYGLSAVDGRQARLRDLMQLKILSVTTGWAAS